MIANDLCCIFNPLYDQEYYIGFYRNKAKDPFQ